TMNPADGSFARSFAEGHVSYFTPQGRVVAAHDSFGAVTTFGYSGNLLTSVTSPTGFVFTLAYQSGRLATITDSAGRTTLFQINAAGNLISTTNPEGTPHTFAYDADHLMVSQTGPRGERSEYDYSNGRVVAARSFDTDGVTLLREREFAPSVLRGEAGVAIAQGQGTILNPIPVVPDNIDIMVDGRGVVHLHEIDGFGNPIRVADGGGETLFTYDALRRRTSRTLPNGARTEYVYDAAGRVSLLRELNPAAQVYATMLREYAGTGGRMSREVDAEGRERRYEYDTLGRLVRAIDALQGDVLFFYENPALPSMPTRTVRGTATVTIAYDAHGNLASVTDPLGHVTTYSHSAANGLLESLATEEGRAVDVVYDLMNRIVSITGGPDGDTTFNYLDPDCACRTDNLIAVGLAGGGVMQRRYDGLGRLIEQIDPTGMSEHLSHDAEDGLVQYQSRTGQSIFYTRDAAGRAIAISDSVGGASLYEYDALGNLTFAQNSHTTVSFTYDFLGRRISAQTVLDYSGGVEATPPVTRQVSYTYDRVGNRLTMVDSLGTHNYQYDALHRLIGRTDPLGHTWDFEFDALGRRAVVERSNGIDTVESYDLASQVTGIQHQNAALATLLGDLYTAYDGDGLLTAKSASASGATTLWSYVYDPRQRLDQATSAPVFGDAQVAVSATFDAANRIATDSEYTYTHDLNGRMTARTRTATGATDVYQYDTSGRLLGVQQTRLVSGSPVTVLTVQYLYDAIGRRTAKIVNGVRAAYVYDGERVLEELDPNGLTRRAFVHGEGNDEPLAYIDFVTDDAYFYHQDRLGSVRGLSDESGALVQVYDYDAFGALVQHSAPALFQPFGYIGRERDRESGLYFMRARYYVPNTGRFLSEDPLGLAAGENFYVYTHNDPVNRIDPTGRQGFSLPKLKLGDFELTLGGVPKPEPPKPVVPVTNPPPDGPGSGAGAGGVVINYCTGGGVCASFGLGVGKPDLSNITNTPVACGLKITF
ncbi:MAG: RHS repeat-associated core domain-containing protein, partial [Planctomycetota bacterium]